MNQKQINVREMLATTKVNTLWGGYRINNQAPELNEFFNNLESNNDLMLIFKSMERFCSLLGSAYIFFDLDENKKIKIGVYTPNISNQIMKMDGLTELAGVGVRTIVVTKTGTKIMTKECRTPNETQIIPYSSIAKNNLIPIDTFVVKVPEVIGEMSKVRTIKHNYGVLSMKQILNKNIIDWEYNEAVLPDAYPVQHLEGVINETLNYIYEEQRLNKTRFFGSFSNQDMERMFKDQATMNQLNNLCSGGFIDNTLVNNFYENIYTPKALNSVVESRAFISTHGSNNNVSISKGDVDIKKLTDGLNSLIETYFNGAGMSYSLGLNSGAAVKSIQEIQNQQRSTFETIKMTNTLRKNQIQEFIERIMIAYGIDPNRFKDMWNFEITSNILNAQDNDYETIIKLQQSGILTTEQAQKRINPDLTEKEITNDLN